MDDLRTALVRPKGVIAEAEVPTRHLRHDACLEETVPKGFARNFIENRLRLGRMKWFLDVGLNVRRSVMDSWP